MNSYNQTLPTIPESLTVQSPRYGKKHTKNVVIMVIEKTLVNLSVLAKLEAGDKLDWTPNGHFMIQKPSRWTSALRFIKSNDRWKTLEHINEVVTTSETLEQMCVSSDRLRTALIKCIHGLRNLQVTYADDILFLSNLNVLIDRLAEKYELVEEETF